MHIKSTQRRVACWSPHLQLIPLSSGPSSLSCFFSVFHPEKLTHPMLRRPRNTSDFLRLAAVSIYLRPSWPEQPDSALPPRSVSRTIASFSNSVTQRRGVAREEHWREQRNRSAQNVWSSYAHFLGQLLLFSNNVTRWYNIYIHWLRLPRPSPLTSKITSIHSRWPAVYFRSFLSFLVLLFKTISSKSLK
jgi:hypothetical protein